MAHPPRADPERLAAARQEAAIMRAEWMLNVNSGLLDTNDLLHEAAEVEGRPLLRLRLRQVLLSRPGWGKARSDSVIKHIMSLTGSKMNGVQTTVAWLLDPRTGGRRYAAWLDAHEPKNGPPWSGFPYAGGPHV